VVGPLRVDASPRSLARRLQAGDIAVIDVLDLDRTSAEALASRRPAAVINVQASISGRYPAGGPSVLAESGIPLIDEVGGAILAVREGTIATLDLAAADLPEARPDDPAEPAAPADLAEPADPADPAEPGEPGEPGEPATGSNPLGRWWLERNQARTARKRASLTWLDELREADAEGVASEDTGPRDAGTTSAAPAEPAARKPGKKSSAKDAVVQPMSGPGEAIAPIVPRRATVEAGGREFTGIVLDAPAIDAMLAEAESGMATQLAVFTANAMDIVDRSRGALLEGDGLPDLGVDIKGKHVLVIAPGYEAAKALRDIKPYIRDRKPVVIAISEAADIAKSARCQPAVIIGSTASVSDASLKGARTVISHGSNQHEGDAGEAKLSALGRDHTSSDLAVASEDLALLLARTGGAKTIVTVGVEATLLDFLESGRADAAGTFLARLSAGARIIDARALASLYRPRWSSAVIVTGVVLAVLALAAALWVNGDSRAWLENAFAFAGTTG
jgi:uncharacterized membrane-anchored protein